MVQKVAVRCEFEAGGFAMRRLETLSVSPAAMGTFSELGKDKAAKGERWAPHFISCAQDTVALTPTTLRLLGYGKPLPLPFNKTSSIYAERYLCKNFSFSPQPIC